MATQVLTSKPSAQSGFLHGLERTATAIGHGLTIANAVKGAIPILRTVGRVAATALPAIL